MACPPTESLHGLLDGHLTQSVRMSLLTHAAGCETCRKVICPLEAGEPLGPFQVLKPRGAGSFGLRFVARDTRDDRRLELESLRESHAWTLVSAQHTKLLGLGQPGLIQVQQVLTERGLGAVASDLTEGPAFETWLETAVHFPRDVVGVWVTAGWGLVAAHRAGAVHGGLGPECLRFDDQGRPRLSGFGVRGGAYEPPEHDHAGATPAGDQFSLAVALVHALSSTGPDDLPLSERLTVVRGKLSPRRFAALEKALHANPDSRFPRLAEFLHALSPSPLKRWIAIAVAVAAVTGVIPLYLTLAEPPCAHADEQALSVWTDGSREGLRASFGKLDDPWAAEAQGAVQERLSRWIGLWSDQAKQFCAQAEKARAGLDSQVYLSRKACLARQLDFFKAEVDELTGGTEATMAQAPLALDLLPAPVACEHPEPPLGEAENRVAKRLDAIELALQTGRTSAAADAVTAAAADARPLIAPLASRGALLEARAKLSANDPTPVVRALDEARALAKDDAFSQLEAAAESARLLGALHQPEPAGAALVDAQKLGQTVLDPRALAHLHRAEALVQLEHDQLDEALQSAEAMRVADATAGRPSEAAQSDEVFAELAGARGQLDAAVTFQQKACDTWREVLTAHHPLLAHCRLRLSQRLLEIDQAGEALEALRPVVQARGEIWKRQRDAALETLIAEVQALSRLDRHAEAYAEAKLALKQAEDLKTPGISLVRVMRVLAIECDATGHSSDAVSYSQAVFDLEHRSPRAAVPLAVMLTRHGELAQAQELFDWLDSPASKTGGTEAGPVDPAALDAARGELELARGHAKDAVTALTRAVAEPPCTEQERLALLARAEYAAKEPAAARKTADILLACPTLQQRFQAWGEAVRGKVLLQSHDRDAGSRAVDSARAMFNDQLGKVRADGLTFLSQNPP